MPLKHAYHIMHVLCSRYTLHVERDRLACSHLNSAELADAPAHRHAPQLKLQRHVDILQPREPRDFFRN